ncbi:hypothetical protein ACI3L1_08025 [Deinococcus sp. SM5_A1]|uniref:hypothetical protein n=1 Tax=Deinococcus sp. SM5_A1 TaxID=3379094 RepID=UPI00385BF521
MTGLEKVRSLRSFSEMSLSRPSSIPFAFITAFLNRTPGLQDVAPLTHLRSSQVAATLSVALCWSADDLAVWAKQGSAHAYLAVDFVLVEHHGTEMQDLDIQYRGGRAVTALSHRFLSAGLVEPGHGPVPLRFDYAVSKRLQTDQFP